MHTIVSTLNQHLTRDLIQKHKTKKKKEQINLLTLEKEVKRILIICKEYDHQCGKSMRIHFFKL